MKRILVVTVLTIIVVAAAGAFWVFSNAGKLAMRYQPEIEKAAGRALNATVSLGEIQVSLLPTLKLNVADVRVAPKDVSSPDQGVTLKDLALHLSLRPLLSSKLHINRLALDQPALVFIKDEHGVYLEGLTPTAPQKKELPPVAPGSGAPKAKSRAATPAALDLSLDSFAISRARVKFKDKTADREYDLSDLNINGGLVLAENVLGILNLNLNAKALGTTLAVTAAQVTFALVDSRLTVPAVELVVGGNQIQAAADYDLGAGTGTLSLNSTALDLASLVPLAEQFGPAITQYQLGGRLVPSFAGSINPQGRHGKGQVGLNALAAEVPPYNLRAGNGILRFSLQGADFDLESLEIGLQLNKAPITVRTNGSLSAAELVIRELVLEAFGGKLQLEAQSRLTDTQAFSAKARGASLQLAPALAALLPQMAVPVEGLLQTFELDLRGAQQPNLKQSLNGTTALQVVAGRIKGINIAGEALQALKLPFINVDLVSQLPPEQQAELATEDTAIDDLRVTAALGREMVNLRELSLQSTIFSLKGTGTISFANQLNLKTDIAFSPEFSAALARRVKEFQPLLDKEGRLVFPLAISGVLPKIVVAPNVEQLIRRSGSRLLEDKAKSALDSLLGGGGEKEGSRSRGLDRLLRR